LPDDVFDDAKVTLVAGRAAFAMSRLPDDYGGMAERFKAPVLKTGDP
jgi:hypothetical protein